MGTLLLLLEILCIGVIGQLEGPLLFFFFFTHCETEDTFGNYCGKNLFVCCVMRKKNQLLPLYPRDFNGIKLGMFDFFFLVTSFDSVIVNRHVTHPVLDKILPPSSLQHCWQVAILSNLAG